MSPCLILILYGVLGVSLGSLRAGQGWAFEDALFSGLFWPLDLSRRCIDLLMGVLVGETPGLAADAPVGD